MNLNLLICNYLILFVCDVILQCEFSTVCCEVAEYFSNNSHVPMYLNYMCSLALNRFQNQTLLLIFTSFTMMNEHFIKLLKIKSVDVIYAHFKIHFACAAHHYCTACASVYMSKGLQKFFSKQMSNALRETKQKNNLYILLYTL